MTAGKNWIRKFVFALAFFNSGLAIVVAQPGLGTGFKPPQQLDGSQSTGEKQPPTASDQLGPQANRPNTQFDNLLRELNSLIPGGVNSSPERKKALEEAVTAFQLKNGQRVIEIFDGQRQKELDFPPNELLLAGLSFAAEDLKTGRVLLERSALLSPDHPSTYAAFARLAINQGRLTDALAMLEKTSRVIEASQISPEYVKFYRQAYLDSMIDLAMRQQRYDDARKYLELQRVDLPQNPKVLMVSAELEFKQKNVDQALAYLNELRKVQPSTRRAETVIALWFERVGDKPRAEKWIKTAAEKYPNDEKVQLAFANWALGQGELPVASEAIAR
ncbi:MAG: tetratricopeptide repeat protein, partial [Planctomycetota bacterium]